MMNLPSVAIAAVMLVVGGCTTSSHHHLIESSSPELLAGEFDHRGPSRLSLVLRDRRFTAEGFEVRRHTDFAALYERYRLSDPKHWDRIFAGFNRSHEVRSAEPVLRAPDGAALSCRLAWKQGATPSGICRDEDGRAYQVRFD